MTPTEEWRPISGFTGYEVSSCGRLRSHLGIKPRLLAPYSNAKGYRFIKLRRDGRAIKRPVHHLVALTFVGARPEGQEIRHLDGDPTNNRAHNLRWGTRVENELDKVRHGTSGPGFLPLRTHCINGHQFDEENTYRRPGGARSCRACYRTSYPSRLARRAARKAVAA